MPRLIDADKLKLTDFEILLGGSYKGLLEILLEKIENAPTVEAEPVRHGHWIKERNPMMYHTIPYVWVCDQCGTAFYYNAPYCGECGAKMDGGRREDEK